MEAYIRRCIESIVNQKDFFSFEVIIVNDGTKERCIEQIQDFISHYPNIILIHQENQGLSEARNTGIRMAKGEFLSFIDSDDWIEPDMMSVMYKAATQADCEIAVCNIRKIYEDNAKLKRSLQHGLKNGSVVPSKEAIDLFFDHEIINGQVCNKLYRAELFKEYHIFFLKGKKYEDLPTAFVLLWHAKKVVFLEDCFYNYLQREGSITKNINLDFWHLIDNAYVIENFLIRQNTGDRYDEKFTSLLITLLFSVYIHLIRHKKDPNFHVLKEKLNQEVDKLKVVDILLTSSLRPMVRLKFILMRLRLDPVIDFIFKVKLLKNKTTM